MKCYPQCRCDDKLYKDEVDSYKKAQYGCKFKCANSVLAASSALSASAFTVFIAAAVRRGRPQQGRHVATRETAAGATRDKGRHVAERNAAPTFRPISGSLDQFLRSWPRPQCLCEAEVKGRGRTSV
jgi:hypothetical protein